MKNNAKYRTPSSFQYKQKAQEAKKTRTNRPVRFANLAKRMNRPRPKS